MIRARAVVLASGAIERGIAYANNDLPGTMLAGAAHTYVDALWRAARRARRRLHQQRRRLRRRRWRCTRRVWRSPRSSTRDPATSTGGPLPQRARAAGLPVQDGCVVSVARGRVHVTGVDVEARSWRSVAALDCDLVCRIGRLESGRAPVLAGARHAALRRAQRELRARSIAAADLHRGRRARRDAMLPRRMADGETAARRALAPRGATRAARRSPSRPALRRWRRPANSAAIELRVEPLWAVAVARNDGKRFVDLQNDVTVRRHRARGARGLPGRSST